MHQAWRRYDSMLIIESCRLGPEHFRQCFGTKESPQQAQNALTGIGSNSGDGSLEMRGVSGGINGSFHVSFDGGDLGVIGLLSWRTTTVGSTPN